MKQLFFIFLICTNNILAQSQSKAEIYFSIIQKADQKIISNDLDSALFFYKKAFEEFDTPFIKELFQATIIASYRKDLYDFYELLTLSIERGLNELDLDLFNEKFKSDTAYIRIKNNFPIYHSHYLQSIDTTLYNIFERLDEIDQIKTQQSGKLDKVLDKNVRGFYTSRDYYITSVEKYGWPTEKRVGIGTVIMGGAVNKYKLSSLPKTQRDNIVYKEYDSILCKDTTEVFILVSGKSINNPIAYQNYRKGNGFLWHHLEHLDDTLNDFVISGMLGMNIHPLFVAQAIERSEFDENDCMLGMGSNIFYKQMRSKQRLKYRVNSTTSERINLNRKTYFIRSLEDEYQILKALYSLEYGKNPKKDLPQSFYKRKWKLIAIFTNATVG